jgi:quinol monooxygenase YgiN
MLSPTTCPRSLTARASLMVYPSPSVPRSMIWRRVWSGAAGGAAACDEPGCLWFDWSRSLDDPDEYVLIEAFRDGDAGAAHVRSGHFRKAQQDLPPHLAKTPQIVNFTIPQDDWSELGELAVTDR